MLIQGHGWCFRKQDVNIPAARITGRRPGHRRVRVSEGTIPRWPARARSAYLWQDACHRRAVEPVLLVGDAAGLAYPQSGEGIRPAIESGLLGALTIIEAEGDYTLERLLAYEERLRTRFRTGWLARAASVIVPASMWTPVARALLGSRSVARHVALDRWFLHAHEPSLAGH